MKLCKLAQIYFSICVVSFVNCNVEIKHPHYSVTTVIGIKKMLLAETRLQKQDFSLEMTNSKFSNDFLENINNEKGDFYLPVSLDFQLEELRNSYLHSKSFYNHEYYKKIYLNKINQYDHIENLIRKKIYIQMSYNHLSRFSFMSRVHLRLSIQLRNPSENIFNEIAFCQTEPFLYLLTDKFAYKYLYIEDARCTFLIRELFNPDSCLGNYLGDIFEVRVNQCIDKLNKELTDKLN